MGSIYMRGIIKQVEDLTLENEQLRTENTRLRKENRELREKIVRMEATMEARIAAAVESAVQKAVAPLLAEIAAKDKKIEQLTAEVDRLKAQINKTSANSSTPPSQNGFNKVVNSREPSKRQSGGQKGHIGKRLELPKNLDELVEKGKARRVLKDYTNGAELYVTRYSIDIETLLVVAEHRYPIGSTPAGAEVIYGDNIKALSILLATEGIVAEERLSDFFNELTNNAIRLSDATIEKFQTELDKNLDPEIEQIKTDLLNGDFMHVDDTPVRTTKKPEYTADGAESIMKESKGATFSAYVRTHSNESATFYTVNPQKDEAGIIRDGFLPQYIGTIVQDDESKFYKYGSANATCGTHLSRDLRGLHELENVLWAGEMNRFILGMNTYKNKDLAADKTCCDAEQLKKFEEDYDKLVEQGRETLSTLKKNELGQDNLRRMVNRLTVRKDNYLLFIRDYRIPFTNNLAERDLRYTKTKQKVSGCFRSWTGIVRNVKIRSFISTLKKRHLPILSSIASILHSLPVLSVVGE